MDALEARGQATFSEAQRTELRLAALFHDIGHLPFSRITEEVRRDETRFPEIAAARAQLKTSKPHEVFSAMIVRSEAFRVGYVEKMRQRFPTQFEGVDFDRISRLIVGDAPASQNYMAKMISGPLDADKLDYILRDCHMTGLKMSVDVDRILQTVLVQPHDGKQTLAVDITGVSTIEQLLFDKLLLNMSVYHHQKVRATECLIKSLYERVLRENVALPRIGRISAVNLLRYCDDDVLALEHSSTNQGVAALARRLTHRELLMRSVEISRDLVDKRHSRPAGYDRFLGLLRQPKGVFEYRQRLSTELGTDVYETWIDCPPEINLDEAANFPVVRRGAPTATLAEVFPVEDWLGSFNQMKYRGHVFVPLQALDDRGYAVISDFLVDEFGLTLKSEARSPTRGA
jgi:HD superfamily phosphohydrolase